MPLIPELRVKIRGAEAGYTEKACLEKQNKRKQKSPFREESKNSILQSILSMKREREIAPMREGKKNTLSHKIKKIPFHKVSHQYLRQVKQQLRPSSQV